MPELKRLGDRVMVAPVTTLSSRRGNDGPTAHVTFDVIDGKLQCVNVEVRKQAGKAGEVTRADLRAVPIDDCGLAGHHNALTCGDMPAYTLKRNSTTSPSAMT